MLRLLESSSIGLEGLDRLIESVPAHCVDAVAEAARNFADRWHYLALGLERRRTDTIRQRPVAG